MLKKLFLSKPFDMEMASRKRSFHDYNSFIIFYQNNRKDIQTMSVLPPRLGSMDFGKIEVLLKPKYRVKQTR